MLHTIFIKCELCRDVMQLVADAIWGRGVAGSNPAIPTIRMYEKTRQYVPLLERKALVRYVYT